MNVCDHRHGFYCFLSGREKGLWKFCHKSNSNPNLCNASAECKVGMIAQLVEHWAGSAEVRIQVYIQAFLANA